MLALDSVLHLLVGGVITMLLFASNTKGLYILLVLVLVSLGKEFFDHAFILGHSFPTCQDEHLSDFLFSLFYFLAFMPILSLTRKDSGKFKPLAAFIIWVIIGLFHLAIYEIYLKPEENMSHWQSSCEFYHLDC